MQRAITLLVLVAFLGSSPLPGWQDCLEDCCDGCADGPACADCVCCPHRLPANVHGFAPRPAPTRITDLELSPPARAMAPDPREILHVPLTLLA